MFPADLDRNAFRDDAGEFGWTRGQIAQVVQILVEQDLAVLGGEVWWLPDGTRKWSGLIPQRAGPDAVYPWETLRKPDEDWESFVKRCAHETLAAVEHWPRPEEVPESLHGRILYNLTWVTAKEYDELSRSTTPSKG